MADRSEKAPTEDYNAAEDTESDSLGRNTEEMESKLPIAGEAAVSILGAQDSETVSSQEANGEDEQRTGSRDAGKEVERLTHCEAAASGLVVQDPEIVSTKEPNRKQEQGTGGKDDGGDRDGDDKLPALDETVTSSPITHGAKTASSERPRRRQQRKNSGKDDGDDGGGDGELLTPDNTAASSPMTLAGMIAPCQGSRGQQEQEHSSKDDGDGDGEVPVLHETATSNPIAQDARTAVKERRGGRERGHDGIRGGQALASGQSIKPGPIIVYKGRRADSRVTAFPEEEEDEPKEKAAACASHFSSRSDNESHLGRTTVHDASKAVGVNARSRKQSRDDIDIFREYLRRKGHMLGFVSRQATGSSWSRTKGEENEDNPQPLPSVYRVLIPPLRPSSPKYPHQPPVTNGKDNSSESDHEDCTCLFSMSQSSEEGAVGGSANGFPQEESSNSADSNRTAPHTPLTNPEAGEGHGSHSGQTANVPSEAEGVVGGHVPKRLVRKLSTDDLKALLCYELQLKVNRQPAILATPAAGPGVPDALNRIFSGNEETAEDDDVIPLSGQTPASQEGGAGNGDAPEFCEEASSSSSNTTEMESSPVVSPTAERS